jgi:hypothetical protein
MSVHAKSLTQVKMKWWFWPMLILGSAMVVGGITWAIIL